LKHEFKIVTVRPNGDHHSLELSGFGAENIAYREFKTLKESRKNVFTGLYDNGELVMFDLQPKDQVKADE
jgi:hypothetical protein